MVTGATGLVGRRLVVALRREGRSVRALTRDPASSSLESGVGLVGWNGLAVQPDTLRRTDAIVHLSGEPVFAGRLSATRRRRIRESRIESTLSIVEALGALPEADRPPVFLCASAVGYYGSRGDEVLDEAAAPGEGFLADVCVEWERAARGAEAHGVRTVMLRIGIVLSRRGGALPRLALPFRLGLGGRLGSGAQWFPWIHLDDLVGLALAALTEEGYRGPVNAVSPGVVTNAELTRAVGRTLRRPTPIAVPAFALRAALGELASELLGSRRVVPRAAEREGFSFSHPTLDEALGVELR